MHFFNRYRVSEMDNTESTAHSTACTVCKTRISPSESSKYSQIRNISELAKRAKSLCDGSEAKMSLVTDNPIPHRLLYHGAIVPSVRPPLASPCIKSRTWFRILRAFSISYGSSRACSE